MQGEVMPSSAKNNTCLPVNSSAVPEGEEALVRKQGAKTGGKTS